MNLITTITTFNKFSINQQNEMIDIQSNLGRRTSTKTISIDRLS